MRVRLFGDPMVVKRTADQSNASQDANGNSKPKESSTLGKLASVFIWGPVSLVTGLASGVTCAVAPNATFCQDVKNTENKIAEVLGPKLCTPKKVEESEKSKIKAEAVAFGSTVGLATVAILLGIDWLFTKL